MDKKKILDELSGKSWTAYGDLLDPLVAPVEEMALSQSESLHVLACLHASIFGTAANLFMSIVALTLARKEYIDSIFDTDSPYSLESTVNKYKMIPKYTVGENFEPRFIAEIHNFVSNKTHQEDIVVCVFQGWPEWAKNSLIFPLVTEHMIQEMKDRLQEGDNGFNTSLKRFLVIDNIVLYVMRNQMVEFKKEIKRNFPQWEILSIEQFMINMLEGDKDDFLKEFEQYRSEVIKNLETMYPFLIPRKEVALTVRSRKEIISSINKFELGGIKEPEEYESIMRTATKGIEGLLHVLYKRSFRIFPEPNWTFNDVFSRLEDLIKDDFGPETITDLKYLNDIRNKVSHPRDFSPKKRDLINCILRADTFLQLFDDFVGYNRR